jgi:molybdopterin/thiamine biosynthesis adenylyltransferase
MGVQKITVLDFDTIEEANLAPQFYNTSHNGMTKATALTARLTQEAMPGQVINGIETKWEEWTAKDEYLTEVDIIIMAVDSMDVRMTIWDDIKYLGLRNVVDARMAREMLEIFAIDPSKEDEVKFYEEHLFPSSTVDHIPCTERAVAYNQFVIAGLIGSIIKQITKKEIAFKRLLFDILSMTLITQ